MPALRWWPWWGALAVVAVAGLRSPVAAPSAASPCAHDPNAVACAAPSNPATAAAAPLTGKPRLVEFTSDYCPVCERMAPLVSQVVGDCSADASVLTVRLEAPEGAALAARYQVAALPAFVTIDATGAEIGRRRVGKLSEDELRTAVQDVTGAPCAL